MGNKKSEKNQISTNCRDFKKNTVSCKNHTGPVLVAGSRFEREVKPVRLREIILDLLQVAGPLSVRQICLELNERNDHRVRMILKRLWRKGMVLRTKQPIFLKEKINRGRNGLVNHVRAVNFYGFNNGKLGYEFVEYENKMKDGRDKGIESKATRILIFLKENKNKAFYSTEIVKALNVKSCDVMVNVRRFERKGLVFVRGYQTHNGRSPFRKGYVITYVDQGLPREEAVKEAFQRTNSVIVEESSSNKVLERVRMIRDQLVVANDLLSMDYFQNVLNCSRDQVRRALKRAMQLYSDIKVVRIFNRYAYYHLDLMDKKLFETCLELKKNYIRKVKGRDNRIGHNWEACVEWFIDKFTDGAEFLTQNHRSNMDKRRITLHLLKSVGDRKQSAEVDRVWKVTPGLFSPTVTYVLECKWSIVTRKTLDDFIEVLKWSTDFGVDTENGRELKKGVVPVFGAGAYNPREKLTVNGQEITLAQYAARMNVKLLRPADFNCKLREHEVNKKVTVQKICKVCRNEQEVRATLNQVFKNPSEAEAVLFSVTCRNAKVFIFEKSLAY